MVARQPDGPTCPWQPQGGRDGRRAVVTDQHAAGLCDVVLLFPRGHHYRDVQPDVGTASDHVLHLLMLRKRGDVVEMSAMVRTNDPRPPKAPPTLFLNTLGGEQYAAALRAAPVSSPPLPLPTRELPQDLEIAVGTTGVWSARPSTTIRAEPPRFVATTW